MRYFGLSRDLIHATSWTLSKSGRYLIKKKNSTSSSPITLEMQIVAADCGRWSRTKMLKLLCLLVAASGVWGQSGLPYTQLLDTKYRISWGYTNETIEFQIDATTTGWISFALLSEDSKLLDIWWGGYDEEYRVNYGQVKLKKKLIKFGQIHFFLVNSF